MINFKQRELSHQLFDQLKVQFPEIEWIDTVESPVYRDSLWVRVLMPADEDREIEMGELAAEISTDILLDHGYHIIISSAPSVFATTV
jgi:hypothetical protein